MFDESLNPLPYVDLQAPEVIAPIPEVVAPAHAVLTGSPSSTKIIKTALFTNQSGRIYGYKQPKLMYKLKKKALYGLKHAPRDACRENYGSLILGTKVDTPMVKKSKLDEDKHGKAVDSSHYHGKIGTLLYLIASRPGLQFAICICVPMYHGSLRKHFIRFEKIFVSKGTSRDFVSEGFFIALTSFADEDHGWLSRHAR
ncbi:hypothetical protein Tco_0073881 [Tanacetum coccineum]